MCRTDDLLIAISGFLAPNALGPAEVHLAGNLVEVVANQAGLFERLGQHLALDRRPPRAAGLGQRGEGLHTGCNWVLARISKLIQRQMIKMALIDPPEYKVRKPFAQGSQAFRLAAINPRRLYGRMMNECVQMIQQTLSRLNGTLVAGHVKGYTDFVRQSLLAARGNMHDSMA